MRNKQAQLHDLVRISEQIDKNIESADVCGVRNDINYGIAAE
jgi:hypothetical protein